MWPPCALARHRLASQFRYISDTWVSTRTHTRDPLRDPDEHKPAVKTQANLMLVGLWGARRYVSGQIGAAGGFKPTTYLRTGQIT